MLYILGPSSEISAPIIWDLFHRPGPPSRWGILSHIYIHIIIYVSNLIYIYILIEIQWIYVYIYIHTSICIYKYIQTYVYIYISNCSKFKVDVTKCISGFALVYTYTPNVQNLKIGLNKTKAFKLLYIYI